jgi:hypothetical protein
MSLTNKIRSNARRRLYENLTHYASEHGYDDVQIDLRGEEIHVCFDGQTVILDVGERRTF